MLTECDLIVVGGGPAGMSAAINAASEGLTTKLFDSAPSFGGQAGESTRIENYAGFPEGVTGDELSGRLLQQARKFGVEMVAPVSVCGVREARDIQRILVEDEDEELHAARAVLLACGVQYRLLKVANLSAYIGQGVTYGSPSLATDAGHKRVYVVGGANSAGQAALHLARKKTSEVHILVRGESLEAKMSAYLTTRIRSAGNITVHEDTEIVRVDGNSKLEAVTVRVGDRTVKWPADRIFVLIGAAPKLRWLNGAAERDEHGFIICGNDIPRALESEFEAKYGRAPLAHESTLAGLFAAGDCRAGSVHRVAGAVGEGVAAVTDIHRYL